MEGRMKTKAQAMCRLNLREQRGAFGVMFVLCILARLLRPRNPPLEEIGMCKGR